MSIKLLPPLALGLTLAAALVTSNLPQRVVNPVFNSQPDTLSLLELGVVDSINDFLEPAQLSGNSLAHIPCPVCRPTRTGGGRHKARSSLLMG